MPLRPQPNCQRTPSRPSAASRLKPARCQDRQESRSQTGMLPQERVPCKSPLQLFAAIGETLSLADAEHPVNRPRRFFSAALKRQTHKLTAADRSRQPGAEKKSLPGRKARQRNSLSATKNAVYPPGPVFVNHRRRKKTPFGGAARSAGSGPHYIDRKEANKHRKIRNPQWLLRRSTLRSQRATSNSRR